MTTLMDSTVHANHSTNVVDTDQTLIHVPGRFGTAIHFDGIEDYVVVPGTGSNLDVGTMPMTITAWFRASECTNEGMGLCSFIGNDNIIYSGEGDQTALSVTSSSELHFHVADSSSWFNMYSASVGMLDNIWHNMVAVWNYPTASIYLDGQLLWSEDHPDLMGTTNLGNFVFGTYRESGCCEFNGFVGDLDEVAIFAEALDLSQIATLQTSPACP